MGYGDSSVFKYTEKGWWVESCRYNIKESDKPGFTGVDLRRLERKGTIEEYVPGIGGITIIQAVVMMCCCAMSPRSVFLPS